MSRPLSERLVVALNDLEGASYRHGISVRIGADQRDIDNARLARMQARKALVALIKSLTAQPSEKPVFASKNQSGGSDA